MNDDSFITLNVKPSDNPLLDLKRKLDDLVKRSPDNVDSKYIQQFVEFAEKPLGRGDLDYLLMPNTGETKMAAGTILVSLGTSKRLDQKAVPELYNNLYLGYKASSAPLEKVHFCYTHIPGIWEWWEEGETKEMPFGIINDDKLVGFVRVGGFA